MELGTIIVPLDGSALSERVLPHAVSLAKALGSAVTLLRTTHFPNYIPMDLPSSVYEDLVRETTAEAEEYLQHISQQLTTEGVAASQAQVNQGEAAGAILDLAGDSSSTLIAMCTHGRSGMGRWVVGSVTDRVVRHSNGPVLVVRASG
jgi:nucleotide-binding universal stress UspA family protein